MKKLLMQAIVAVMAALSFTNARAYTDVEYITTSAANQNWILLDYWPVKDTIIEATVEVPTDGLGVTKGIFCARGTSWAENTMTCFVMDANEFRYDYSKNGAGAAQGGTVEANKKYVVTCDPAVGLTVNGERIGNATSVISDFKAGNRLMLFASYTGATSATPTPTGSYSTFKVYRVRIWEGSQTDENLQFDLIPCLNDQGVPGLRDAAPNPKEEFYPSRGANAFGYAKKTFVWKGTGTTAEANRWSIDSNWEGGVAPTANDFDCCISIPAAVQGSVINNDIANLQVGELNIASSAGFTLTGEPLALTGGGSFVSTTPDFRCELPFVLAEGATNAFSIADGRTNTFAADTLRGKGGLRKIEEGTMILEGDNTFEGDVVLYRGFVKMSTPLSLGAEGKTVRIGPNHVQSEQHTQLNLTMKMDFKYNLEFVRQTGQYYHSAKYLTCPDGTQIYGTIRVGETSGMCINFGPDSGTLTCYGDVSIYGGSLFLTGTVDFRGRVLRTGTEAATVSCQSGYANFYASGNTVDQINQGYGTQNFYGENLLHDAFIFNVAYEYGTGAIKLNGYDQVCGGFETPSSYWNKTEAHHPVETPVGKPCCLTVKPSSNRTGRFHFNGPITLVVDSSNGRTQAVVNAESTMTGELIVSNGAFKVGYKAPFPYVAGFEIGANGRLIVTNGVAVGTGDSDFRLTTGGRLVLENGATMSVNRICKDGETVMSAYGKTFCAPGAGVAGAEEADWIEGSGSLTVNSRVIEDDERTWTGGAGAGGENESMLDPRNWEPGDTAPTLVEGGLYPTFATEGTNAWFAGNLDANGMIFNAPNDFTVTAKDANGTVCVAAAGIAATGAHAYTIDAALALRLGQTWTAAKGTTLKLARGILATSDYALFLEGGGTFVMEGEVSLDGNINLTGSTLTLRNGWLSSTLGTLVPQDSGSSVRLENGVVDKPMTVPCKLVSGQGTTNLINSKVTWAGGSLSIEKDSQLTLVGGISNGGYNSFSGAGKDVSTLIVTNGTLSSSDFSFSGMTAHFWSKGNSIADYLPVGNTAQLLLHVENVFMNGTPIDLKGVIDFCGNNQQCACLKDSSDTGRFYSEQPAVLTVYQRNGANLSSDADAARTFVGHFEGAAGLKKLTAAVLTLNATNPTAGSLEVAGGELVMGASATWGGTDVSLTAADARLSLQSANNLVKQTVLKVKDAAARVNVAAGVQVRVQQMYVPSASRPGALKQLGPGVYTSANCPYVTGEGSIEVRGMGLVLFVL